MSFGAQIIFENVNLNIPDNVKIGGDYIGNYNEKTNCISFDAWHDPVPDCLRPECGPGDRPPDPGA